MQGGDAGFQHLAEVDQGLVVHQHPRLLHLRQHRAEGELQLLIHFCQAQLGQLAGEQVVEPEEEAGVAGHGRPGLGGALLVLPGLGSQVVLGRGKSASKYCRPTLSSS